MGQSGPFWNDMETVFGQGNVTSGFRSQAEQDALVAAGKTRATRSSHTYENGYDISIGAAKSEQEIRQRLAAQGIGVRKVIRESGRGRNQGTGPHWHVELDVAGPNAGGVPANTSRPGGGVANPQAFLAGLESQLGPEAMASGNVSTSAPGTFGSDSELQNRVNNVESALGQQGVLIDTMTAVNDAAQAVQVASMTEMVEETRAISDEISRGTDELRRQVQPVFQARGRIADQLDKLNTMNPLERGLRSIFDLNYDRGFLKNQLDNYDRTLQMRANDYDYINKLHEAAMGEIERRYSLDNALPGLAVQQVEEDLGIVGMRIQQTAGMLGTLRDRVSGETQLISAKALAREDMLSRLDGPTIMGLANQAKQNNGVINYNGVEFSYNELRDRLERDEDQELNREAHRMAIAQGRMDMAEQFAINIARSLTRQQAEAAIANGGVHNGIQLPQDVLQNIYQNHVQTAKTQAEELQTTLPTTIALRVATDELTRITGIHTRTKGMFGGAGVDGASMYLQNGADMIRELIAATERGDPPEVIAALTQRIASNSKAMEERLDKALLRQSGGNKEQAGYLKAFVMGTPLDSAAAVQAITHFAVRGTRPDGIAMTPEAKQVFQQAERIVKSIREENPKIGADTLRQQVSIRLGEYASKAVGQARYERVSQSLPQLARTANHPLGKLGQDAWSRVRANASAQAYAAVAQELGVSVEQVRKMRSTGKQLSDAQEDKDLFARFQKAIPSFNAVEQQALIEGIDDLPMITPGRRNSTHLIDFLQSPDLLKQSEIYTQAVGSESFGDYIVNPISAGALENMLGQDATALEVAQADLTQSQRQASRAVAATFGNNAMLRTQVILSSIPGVGKDGMRKLTPVIEAFIKENPDQFSVQSPWDSQPDQRGESGGLEFENTRLVREERRILSFLQRSKFEDPALETWRKQAIKGWQQSATQTNTLMQNFIDLVNPF